MSFIYDFMKKSLPYLDDYQDSRSLMIDDFFRASLVDDYRHLKSLTIIYNISIKVNKLIRVKSPKA